MVVDELLAECGVERRDVAFVVPHQANITVLRSLAERLDMDISKIRGSHSTATATPRPRRS